jgi:uncharacterized protein YjbJ (UPF0337 family)
MAAEIARNTAPAGVSRGLRTIRNYIGINAMNSQIIRGNWDIVKGKLKQKYASLTDNDLRYVEGQEDELIGRLEKKTGAAREELERFLRDEPDRR